MKPITNYSTISLSISTEEKEYLSLFSIVNHTSKKAVLDKSISTAIRRLRALHPRNKLIDRLAVNMLCRWNTMKKNTTLDSFIDSMESYFSHKGVRLADRTEIIQKFIDAKEKNDSLDEADAGCFQES